MPQPKQVALTHYRGDSFTAEVTVWDDEAKTVPTDFTGVDLAAQLRATPDDEEVLATFDLSVDGNVITLMLTPEQTAALPGSVAWDVQADWDGDGVNVSTLLAGKLTIAPDVTRVTT